MLVIPMWTLIPVVIIVWFVFLWQTFHMRELFDAYFAGRRAERRRRNYAIRDAQGTIDIYPGKRKNDSGNSRKIRRIHG